MPPADPRRDCFARGRAVFGRQNKGVRRAPVRDGARVAGRQSVLPVSYYYGDKIGPFTGPWWRRIRDHGQRGVPGPVVGQAPGLIKHPPDHSGTLLVLACSSPTKQVAGKRCLSDARNGEQPTAGAPVELTGRILHDLRCVSVQRFEELSIRINQSGGFQSCGFPDPQGAFRKIWQERGASSPSVAFGRSSVVFCSYRIGSSGLRTIIIPGLKMRTNTTDPESRCSTFTLDARRLRSIGHCSGSLGVLKPRLSN